MLDETQQQLIGDYIHMQRLIRNLSTYELARCAGISAKELIRIEDGRMVSMLSLTGIARVFEMYTSDLIQAAIPNLHWSTDLYLNALFSDLMEV